MWSSGGAYNEWAAFLEQWAAGSQDPGAGLPRLTPEDFTSDSWVRLTHRLSDALSVSLKAWAATLTRSIQDSCDEFGVGRALAQGRDGLRRVRALAVHPRIPPDLREQLLAIVDTQVASAQRLLEDQVERMRKDGVPAPAVEARLRTLRDNRLTVVAAEAPGRPPVAGAVSWAADPTAPRRRQVIIE